VQPSCQPLRRARACARLAAASNLRARSEGAVDLVDNDDLADPKWIIAPTVAGPRGAELEDLWHDMFIKFLREPSILKSVVPEARETYVRVATRRHALNHLRGRRRHEAPIARLPTSEASETVGTTDARLEFERFLNRVDERDRDLVRWRLLEDISIGAIARRAGLSYSAAAVRIFRALAKARDSLKHSNA
jgi:RNA polymerase sigma factor (sigma-70 family)